MSLPVTAEDAVRLPIVLGTIQALVGGCVCWLNAAVGNVALGCAVRPLAKPGEGFGKEY